MQTRRYFTLLAKDEVLASETAVTDGEDVDWLGCMFPTPAVSRAAAGSRQCGEESRRCGEESRQCGEESRVGAATVDVSVGDDGVVDAQGLHEMAMALGRALFDNAAEADDEVAETVIGVDESNEEETFCNPGEIEVALTDASSSSGSDKGEAAHDAVAVGASSDVVDPADANRAALLERNPDDIKIEMLADHNVWEVSRSGEPIKLLGTARYVRDWSSNVKLSCECHRVRSPAISHQTTYVARSPLYYQLV